MKSVLGRLIHADVPATVAPWLRRAGLVSVLAMCSIFDLPDSASANTSCSYESSAKVLSVSLGAPNDSAILTVVGTEIRVNQSTGPVTCANGPATLSDTDYVSIGGAGGATSTTVSMPDISKFAGLVGLLLGAGDTLYFGAPSSATSHFVLGNGGVDTDGDADKDITFFAKPKEITAGAGSGEDTISAQGGSGTGAALTGSFLKLSGGPGNDTLDGGEAGDLLEGEDGDDLLRGHGGDDQLIGDFLVDGDDTLDGGAGTDGYGLPFNVSDPLTLDLGRATPQVTGYGNDTVAGIENADGTNADDVLLGDAGSNDLQGLGGDDFVDGGGGDDVLDGDSGIDTLSYADAPAGVVVSLDAGSASGGEGTDTATDFEDLIGSPFADVLTGSAAADAITAGGGADVVQALGGPDLVDVRDGVADNVGCGSEVDRAVSDRRTIDTIAADCELIDALPEPAQAPPMAGGETGASGVPGGGGTPRDTRLDFRLGGRRGQRLVVGKAIVLRLRCPAEACGVVVRASRGHVGLKKVTKKIPAGPVKLLRLRLGRAQREAIAAQLRSGARPRVKVTAVASDAAGNRVRRTLVVTARP